ncbi:MAG: hypothetical protein HFE63_07550 [Clostridiales bacterium]|nr:hypothetical protein [Clostridiales bacterium]
MADNALSERLNQLLSNPAALTQLMSLASTLLPALGANSAPAGSQPNNAETSNSSSAPMNNAFSISPQPESPYPISETNNDTSHEQSSITVNSTPQPSILDSLLGGNSPLNSSATPQSLGGDIPTIGRPDNPPPKPPSSFNNIGSHSGGDRRCALLNALKPYLRHSRADKIDMMIKVLQISELTHSTFGGRKLF